MKQSRTDPLTVVILDASVLINFLVVGRLDLLSGLNDYRFVIPQDVLEEIRIQQQRSAIAQAVRHRLVQVESITAIPELTTRRELRSVMGKGEAACLAMAQHRGWSIACDERGRFLRICEERLGPGHVLTTPHLILAAIRTKLITWRQADHLKAKLERRRFKMPFRSFRELVTDEGSGNRQAGD